MFLLKIIRKKSQIKHLSIKNNKQDSKRKLFKLKKNKLKIKFTLQINSIMYNRFYKIVLKSFKMQHKMTKTIQTNQK